MEVKRRIDRDRICRVCLQDKTDLFLLFEDVYAEDGVKISEVLSECTRYKVERFDRLPQQICGTCMQDARSAFRFKKRTEQAYRTLVGMLPHGTALKVSQKPGVECVDNGTQTEKCSIHPCELCDEKFFDVLELRDHRALLHRDHKNQCKVCGKKFEKIRQLRSHLALMHPSEGFSMKVTCTVCHRQFTRRDHLQRHMKIHAARTPHISDPAKLFKCPMCQLQFSFFEQLHLHMRDHHQSGPPKLELEKSLDEPEIDPQLEMKPQDITDGHTHWLDNAVSTEDDFNDPNMTNPISCEESDENNDANDYDDDHKASGFLTPEGLFKMEPEVVIKAEFPDVSNTEDFGLHFVDHDDRIPTETTTPKREADEINIGVATTAVWASLQEDVKPNVKNETVPKRKVQIIYENRMKVAKNGENRCPECQRTFSRHCHLTRHMLTHLEQKAHACSHCSKRFARSDHLKKHVMNVHNTKEFKCEQCNCAFARNEELLRHKDTRHGSDPNAYKIHECEYCLKKFCSKTYLRQHILMHTDRVFSCRHCEQTFKERKLCREHEKTHSSGRNFLCSMCGESFVRNDYLRVHMRRHSGEKPYKCQYCGKGFPRATDVKMHERYHTGHKPNLCTLCGKRFHRAYNLTIHMRTHTGERPFKCDQCPKSFAQSNDLKAHIRRHTGERFRCEVCGAAFLQMYGLRQHALSAHGIHMESFTGRLQKFPSAAVVETPIATQSVPSAAPLTATSVAPLMSSSVLPLTASSVLPLTASSVSPLIASSVAPLIASSVGPLISASVSPLIASSVAPLISASVAPLHAPLIAPLQNSPSDPTVTLPPNAV